jgi:hypothetical protein
MQNVLRQIPPDLLPTSHVYPIMQRYAVCEASTRLLINLSLKKHFIKSAN